MKQSYSLFEDPNNINQVNPSCLHGEYLEQEFWTAKQRQSHSLHEISYRACFKAELPRFFIEKYSSIGDTVYDPFSGRGTTGIEALLLNRKAIFNDINPLSQILSESRTYIAQAQEVLDRLSFILSTTIPEKPDIDLSMFFHHDTLNEILQVKTYLMQKQNLDYIDKWIRLLVLTRLTGHSCGFLSNYTLPPNQSVSPARQIKINEKYGNKSTYRSLIECCIKKYKSLTRSFTDDDIFNYNKNAKSSSFYCNDASKTHKIIPDSVDLIITSPPFLDIVNYKQDNWMRCWFCGIESDKLNISIIKNIQDWTFKMQNVIQELHRVLKKQGFIVFEVGEVRNGTVNLESYITTVAKDLNIKVVDVLINKQVFTKTSNIWGVKNNTRGTNTNRIIIMQK